MALPEPPYYAVIFSTQRSSHDEDGYAKVASRMMSLAAETPGFLGVSSSRGADGFGITVSYWESEQAIAHWKSNAEHVEARENGRAHWYERYDVRIAKVERSYDWSSA